MKTQLYIGQSQLRGTLSKYAARFNFIELRAERDRVPRLALLRRWTEEVNRDFVFAVMLPRGVAAVGNAKDTELRFGLDVADALSAQWLVLQTDPTIGPSQRSRERLKALFASMQQDGRRIAWEPHGVWQEEEALNWTRELGVHLVRDVTRGEPVTEETLYVRVPGLGVAARLSSGALEKAAESLVQSREAYVVLGGEGAARAAQSLRTLVRDAEDFRENDVGAEGPFVFDENDSDEDEFESDEEGDDWDDDSEDSDEDEDEQQPVDDVPHTKRKGPRQ